MIEAQVPRDAAPGLLGYVVLGRRRGDNAYKGIIECSFSMDLSPDCACFFWSSDRATSNFGGSFEVDGRKDAEHHRDEFSRTRPDMEFEVFDVHADDLPVRLLWEPWRRACEPAGTLSGVRSKFYARNVRFEMREDF